MTTPALDPAAIRAHLMLTLSEMAERVGVNRATVWRWEQGATPRPTHQRKLAKMAKEEAR